MFDVYQAVSLARTSSSAGVKHLIQCRSNKCCTGLHEMAMADWESQYNGRMSSPYLIVNSVGSIVPLEEPLDIKNFESSSYQALGA
ncbi:hypothetical protein Tco_0454990 [Tanacetum coccineum]